ncbi:MAG: hypothetical protein JNL12_01985 [Planctomycetes bacterium]|nr:hypothetical protein [Planctomycetota bacterium]
MADRLRWWVIPGALVVMARVVTLESGDPAAHTGPVEATSSRAVPAAHEAVGPTLRMPLAATAVGTKQAFVLELPATLAGHRVETRVWRAGEAPHGEPWLQFSSTVRSDGTIPVAGLAAGRYDVEVHDPAGRAYGMRSVAAPGRVPFDAAMPLR